jgi:hypothetical protein
MPRLTAQELQAARVRSGRLGGRPRKPTVEEARPAALEELVPAAIKSLQAHLGDGNPDAWRAALRVFDGHWADNELAGAFEALAAARRLR